MSELRTASIRQRAKRRYVIVAGVVVGGLIAGGSAIAFAMGPPFSSKAATGDTTAAALDECGVELQRSVGSDLITEEIEHELVLVTADRQQSTLVSSGDYSIWCQGRSGELGPILIDSPWFTFPEPASEAVLVGPRTQNVAKDGYTFVLGRSGSAVDSVSVSVGGIETRATLENGWWTAAWPTGDESELETASVAFSTATGFTEEHPLNELLVPDED